MDKNAIINSIINIEWDMFHNVENEGGKAACQLNKKTFEIMRSSQYNGWGQELLASWLADLEKARTEKRNLMSEKYAHMMEHTFPEKYEGIKDQIAPVDPAVAEKIDKIVAAHLKWKESLNSKYPHLAERGRPLNSVNDSNAFTSFETYLRGELQTYSPATIDLYYNEVQQRLRDGKNEAEENLLAQINQYGFTSLEAAEEFLKNKDEVY